MTVCPRCRARYAKTKPACPSCGASRALMFKTGAVKIWHGETAASYRSIRAVPPPLRRRLMEAIHGPRSATVLIADRRGRRLLAALRRPRIQPVSRQRRRLARWAGLLLATSALLLVWLLFARI